MGLIRIIVSKYSTTEEPRTNCIDNPVAQHQSGICLGQEDIDIPVSDISRQDAIGTMRETPSTVITDPDDESEQNAISSVAEPHKLPAQVPEPLVSSTQSEIRAPYIKPSFGPSAREALKELRSDHHPANTTAPPSPPSQPYHHRGFWLYPEPFKNDTDPAISLAILMSPMKGFMATRETEFDLRKYTLAWAAHKLLDPVVYTGDFNSLREKKISERRDFAIGEVFKYYTQNGTWQWDRLSEDESEPWADFQLGGRGPVGCTVINGQDGGRGQPTHESLVEDMERAERALNRNRKTFTKKRSSPGFENCFGPSPLSKAYTPESMVAEQKEDDALFILKRRAARSLRANVDVWAPQSFEKSWVDLESDSDSDSSDD